MFAALVFMKYAALLIFLTSVGYIHFRGKVRFRWLRQLVDHSVLLAPFNALIYLCSGVPNNAILKVEEFPELEPLRENWEAIRDEAQLLHEGNHIADMEDGNDLVFHTFARKGWKRFYLRWYDDTLPSARELCPKTVALIESIPSLNSAMFAVMAPRSRTGPHRDPFAGSLRYHLGLTTPNSEACRIVIDGTPRAWRDGEAFVFDETYIHQPINDTEQTRIILFCDVTRPIRNPVVRALNWFFIKFIAKVTASRNVKSEKLGLINRLFRVYQPWRTEIRSLKQRSVLLYYASKYVIMALVLYFLFLVDFVQF